MSQQKRKHDAHRKIMMGGLVIKAGLDNLHDNDKDILLGILVDAKQQLDGNNQESLIKHYKDLGNRAFNDSKEPT